MDPAVLEMMREEARAINRLDAQALLSEAEVQAVLRHLLAEVRELRRKLSELTR